MLNHNAEEDCDEAGQFFELCFSLDERLSKRIIAKTDTLSLDWRLMHVCHIFSDLVQLLKISIKEETCLKSVYQIFKNCCPNLKQLRIKASFMEGKDLDLAGLQKILQPKPSLTLLSITSRKVTPFLASLVQLVVKASPNLKGITLSWGLFPDFANSKCLNSLTIVLDDVDPVDIIHGDGNIAKLHRLLGQVGDELVSLSFANINGSSLVETLPLPRSRFQLPRKLPKLQNFRNDVIDVFQCDDLFQNIEMMPSLKIVEIAIALDKSTRVDEILQNMCDSKKTLGSVKKLTLRDMYDPRVVDGLTKVFPALEQLRVDTFYPTIVDGEVNRN